MTDDGTPGSGPRSDGRLATAFDPGGDRSLLVDAVLGAVATIALSFVPLSPILGGAVSAYLNRDRELLVGALSGLLAAVPTFVVILGFLLLVPIGAGFVGGNVAGGVVLLVLVALVGLLLVTVWTVVLGALGGVVGAALADRYPEPPW